MNFVCLLADKFMFHDICMDGLILSETFFHYNLVVRDGEYLTLTPFLLRAVNQLFIKK